MHYVTAWGHGERVGFTRYRSRGRTQEGDRHSWNEVTALMRFSTASLLLVLATAQANNNDRFNYGFSDVDISGGTDYGQQNWGDVSCDDLQVCVSYSMYTFEGGVGR